MKVCARLQLPPVARETAKILLEELEVAATLRGFASVTRDEFIEAVDRAWKKLQAPEGILRFQFVVLDVFAFGAFSCVFIVFY